LKEFTTVKYFLLLTPTKLEGSRLVWVSIDGVDQGIWEKWDQAKSLKKVCLHARDRQGGFTEYHSETLEFALASWQRESQTHLCFPRENGCANT